MLQRRCTKKYWAIKRKIVFYEDMFYLITKSLHKLARSTNGRKLNDSYSDLSVESKVLKAKRSFYFNLRLLQSNQVMVIIKLH